MQRSDIRLLRQASVSIGMTPLFKQGRAGSPGILSAAVQTFVDQPGCQRCCGTALPFNCLQTIQIATLRKDVSVWIQKSLVPVGKLIWRLDSA